MSILDDLTKSLTSVYLEKLNAQEQAELIECLEVLADDQKYNQFKNTFPDTGEFSRDKYKKHVKFFSAGREYKERGFIAANRIGKCLTRNSFVDLADGTRKTMQELFDAGKEFYVKAYDESTRSVKIARASRPFKKEKQEQCVRLYLSNGKWIETALNHRILTSCGWRFVGEIVGTSNSDVCYAVSNSGQEYLPKYQAPQQSPSLSACFQQSTDASVLHQHKCGVSANTSYPCVLSLIKSFASLLRSTLGNVLSGLWQGAVHLKNTVRDFLFDCLVCLRSRDAQPPLFGDSGLCASPSRGGVRRHHFDLSCLDDLASRYNDTSQQCEPPPSNRGDLLQNGGRFAVSVCRASGNYDVLRRHSCLDGKQRHLESASELLLDYAIPLHQKQSSSFSVSLVDDVEIIAWNRVGYNDVYDFEVEQYHNYIASGIVHHNSVAGAYEVTCHATGLYPEWWDGLRFSRPVMIWAGGDTGQTCRDIIQYKLLGRFGDFGSGMIPKDCIVDTTPKRGIPEAVESIYVRHISGGTSTIQFKSYEQGRKNWQGTEVDFCWIDEECPEDVYGEAIIRTMTTKGSIILTFTPLSGLTPLVVSFLDNSQETEAKFPKHVTNVTWADVPHIAQEEKDKILASTPPQLRDARERGEPTVGDGRIYPIDSREIIVDDFPIPKHWMRAYGMDVGWNNTAACFGAWDKDTDIIYIYSEHKAGQQEPILHAQSIKARGTWLKGAIDPAARGRSQVDGENLFALYKKQGLNIVSANNAVEAGIYEVWQRLASGRLKFFKSCQQLLREYGMYHRKEGQIVKTNDHLIDSLRYLINTHHSIWQYPKETRPQNKVTNISEYAMRACV